MLRDYQEKLDAEIDIAINEGARSILATTATGGGKTYSMSHRAKKADGPTVEQAHRQELVYQISMAMARDGVDHRILAPDAVSRFIIEKQIEKHNRSFIYSGAQHTVASVDTLLARAGDADLIKWAKRVALAQTDEGHHCCSKDTLISTPKGDVSIQDIRAGDEVFAWSGDAFVIRHVTEIMRNPMPESMVRLQSSHHVLECTGNHPILAKRGWINAGDIKINDDVLLFGVWGEGDEPSLAPAEQRSNLLQQDLLGSLSIAPVIDSNGTNKSNPRISTDAQKEPHALSHSTSEGFRNHGCAGMRQRQTDDEIRSIVIPNAARDNAGCGEDGLGLRSTALLQNRCCTGGLQNSDRSGRKKSSNDEASSVGCTQRYVSDWSRVESVEIYKPSDSQRNGDGFVYNFEVDEHHNYIANGIVVHNCLEANKWGRALNMFSNALRIAWTATAMRPDRKSLRKGCGGIYDRLIIGPNTRELLDRGFLSPYKIYGPPPSIDMAGALIGDTGDYSKSELSRRAAKSTIVGDMLQHYRALAWGKIGIGFCIDVEQAKESAARFQEAGVPCAWMSSRETDDRKRVATMEALRAGKIWLIFNVDLLGEGVDVPRVEVIIDGRPTMSLVRYLQLFGRLLRLYPGKEFGIYIDMVGNVIRHGMPDRDHAWSLDVAEKHKQRQHDEDALTACTACFKHYEDWRTKCPHCGHRDKPMIGGGASRPDQVDGDLTEYSPELLARLQLEAARIIGPAPRGKVPAYIEKNWNARAVAQERLREAMAWWAGTIQNRMGVSEAEAYRLFYHRFGVDAATAQQLSFSQAEELIVKLWEDINNEFARPNQSGVDPLVVDDNEISKRGYWLKKLPAIHTEFIYVLCKENQELKAFGDNVRWAEDSLKWIMENPDKPEFLAWVNRDLFKYRHYFENMG